jgi:aspartate kinase
MKTIIQKFGGTSVATKEGRELCANAIKVRKDEGFDVVVVVSAMGRSGEPYATDTLKELAEDAFPEVSENDSDLLLSCGEIISSVVMVQTLKKIGLEAISLTGAQAGILTDENSGNANIKKVYPTNLLQILESDKIPVVAGFQGISESGNITTLGRGGSDTTACALGVAIKAEFVEIFTDVPGIMSADPNIIPESRLLNEISYSEAFQMANQGAKVIHPEAAELSKNADIPLIIRTAFQKGKGTKVYNFSPEHTITAVTSKTNITFVKISGKAKTEVFSLIADSEISADFIDIRPGEITFIFSSELKNKVKSVLSEYDFTLSDDFVKISVIGAGMTGKPGVMAKVVECLKGIEIYQSTDSHTTISCLIKKDKETEALQALHSGFGLGSKRM